MMVICVMHNITPNIHPIRKDVAKPSYTACITQYLLMKEKVAAALWE